MRHGYKAGSECADFGLGDISRLLFGDVEKVEDSVVAHHGQLMVLLVECYRLQPFVHLDLSQAQVRLEVLAHDFHKRKTTTTTS